MNLPQEMNDFINSKTKSLFKDGFDYNQTGKEVCHELNIFLNPFLEKYLDQGIPLPELEALCYATLSGQLATKRLKLQVRRFKRNNS